MGAPGLNAVKLKAVRLTAFLIVLLLACWLAGCVDLISSREVLMESSWYGRVTDDSGQGIPDATVTLHVLNAGGEVYQRQAQAASSEPVRGIYAFEHIELREGADRAYTTCNVTADGRTMSAASPIRSLVEGAKASTMRVNGKNITVVTYGGVVDERLVLK